MSCDANIIYRELVSEICVLNLNLVPTYQVDTGTSLVQGCQHFRKKVLNLTVRHRRWLEVPALRRQGRERGGMPVLLEVKEGWGEVWRVYQNIFEKIE